MEEWRAIMTREEFLTWKAYDRIEPIGDARGDVQTAQICQAVSAVAAGFAGQRVAPLTDHMIDWNAEPEPEEQDTDAWHGTRDMLSRVWK